MGLSKPQEILYSMWIINWKVIAFKGNRGSSGNDGMIGLGPQRPGRRNTSLSVFLVFTTAEPQAAPSPPPQLQTHGTERKQLTSYTCVCILYTEVLLVQSETDSSRVALFLTRRCKCNVCLFQWGKKRDKKAVSFKPRPPWA